MGKFHRRTHLGSVELDPGLALDERGRQLHDHSLHRVGGRPTLRRHQFHAQRAPVQHVAAVQDGVHHAHEGRVEGKRVLQGREGWRRETLAQILCKSLGKFYSRC